MGAASTALSGRKQGWAFRKRSRGIPGVERTRLNSLSLGGSGMMFTRSHLEELVNIILQTLFGIYARGLAVFSGRYVTQAIMAGGKAPRPGTL